MRYTFSEDIKNKIVLNKLVKESDIMELLKEYSIESDFYNYKSIQNDYKQQGITFKQLIYHFLMDDKVYNKHQYCSWTSTKREDIKDTYYINVIKHYTSMESMYYGNKLCVRLVKDK